MSPLSHITAQDLYNITKCAHRVYLDANGDPKDRSEVGSFVKLLWELGIQTEREYIGTLGGLPVSDLSQFQISEVLPNLPFSVNGSVYLIKKVYMVIHHRLVASSLLTK